MPIRGLDFVKKSSLNTWIVKAQSHVLKDSIVAIDAFWFLRKYVAIGNIHDLFINRCDERFIAPVLKLIKMANASKFQILWVWDGLDFKKPVNESKKDEIEILRNGFQFLKKNDFKASNQIWKQLVDYEDIIVQINKLLKQFGHEAVRAPYLATAQIAYYLQNDICSYAFCKNDTLIFEGVEKIIIDFHLENSDHFMFTAFNKKDFMKSYELSYQNFRILAFALGCEFCPTIPEYAENFIFENVVTIVKTRDFDSYLEENAKTNKACAKYLELFYTAFVLIDFHPVMKEEGKVAFYKDAEVVPSNFEDCFGKKLPNKLYEAFFFCEVSKGILESISKKKKRSPLSNLSYRILNSKFAMDGKRQDLKEDLTSLLTKNFKMCDKLSQPLQILIYYLTAENVLTKPCLAKLICTINLKKNLIMNNEKVDFECDYEILEFIYKCNKVLQDLKEVVECYKLVTKDEVSSIFDFDLDVFLFSYLYYQKFKDNLDDSGIKFINSYLSTLSDFANMNIETNALFKSISQELSSQ